MQLPNPPWYRRWSVILAGVIGLAAITAMLGWRGLQEMDPQAATTTTTITTRPPSTTTTVPPTSPTTTTLSTSDILWSKTGSDIATSPGIRADGAWRIEWSFDCSNFKKYGLGNFKITGDGAFERVEIQKDGLVARGSRTFPRGGFGHLTVSSVCDRWTVTVLDA